MVVAWRFVENKRKPLIFLISFGISTLFVIGYIWLLLDFLFPGPFYDFVPGTGTPLLILLHSIIVVILLTINWKYLYKLE